MSESDRVQRWRQRQREAGKEPLTIWLTTAEKLRLEDIALTRHCSPSALVQQALAQWRGESTPVPATVTATEQLRALVQQELTQTHIVTATVTDTVTATLQQTLPALVRTLLAEQQARSVTAPVTDTAGATTEADVTATVSATESTEVSVPVADTMAPYDASKYRLGKLCPRGHEYQGTGQSLRKNNKAGGCLACDAEKARERRQTRREVPAL